MNTTKINKGDIWEIDLDPTKGREEAKKRPCLIFSANWFNRTGAELLIVIPMTSKKRNIPLHIEVVPPLGGLKTVSYIMCEQIKSVSVTRVLNFYGKVNDIILIQVEDVLKKLLDFQFK